MSTTSTEARSLFPAIAQDGEKNADQEASDFCATSAEPRLLEILSLSSWRTLLLETAALLALLAALRHWFFEPTQIPGMPHPYWLPVLLAASQYGVTGGMIATVAACAVYWLELSPPAAAQDFYTYAGLVAVQPAAWLTMALVLGGIRSLHIYQANELAERLAACRRCAGDLADELERATAEITALERRIASETGSVAALSRSLSKMTLSNRAAAAASLGELFRVGTGARTFTIYLRRTAGYFPIFAVEHDVVRPAKSASALHATAIAPSKHHQREAAQSADDTGDANICRVVLVPPADVGAEPLAAIVCSALRPSQDENQFRARADELARAFARILAACPDQPSEVCR